MYLRSTALIVLWYPRPCWRKNVSTSGSIHSVICFFGPGQRMAFLKKSGPSSGEFDTEVAVRSSVMDGHKIRLEC
jgi:hypothetical protein